MRPVRLRWHSAPTVDDPAAVRPSKAQPTYRRSADLRLAVSAVSLRAQCRGHFQACDAGALAPKWLLSVLAVEVAPPRRSPYSPGSHPRFDPDDQPREPALGAAPRIHGELLKLGIDVAQSTVAKYMLQRRGPPSPGWRAFLRNHTAHIAAMDLFVVPTVGSNCCTGWSSCVWRGDGWFGPMSPQIQPASGLPGRSPRPFLGTKLRYLIRDRDTSYGAAVTRWLRTMGIRDRPITPRSPWQNGHVERLIGSIQRECLDHVVVLGESHLRHLLL